MFCEKNLHPIFLGPLLQVLGLGQTSNPSHVEYIKNRCDKVYLAQDGNHFCVGFPTLCQRLRYLFIYLCTRAKCPSRGLELHKEERGPWKRC